MIRVTATPSGYTGSIYVVFDKNDYINKYELYRDGVKIAESENAEGKSDFCQPTVFDHDHHTNLFRKKSTHQLMYEDTNVAKFRQYAYHVRYYHGETPWDSNIVYATLQ